MGVNGSDVLVTDLDRQFILGVTHCEQLLLLKLIVQYVVVSASLSLQHYTHSPGCT